MKRLLLGCIAALPLVLFLAGCSTSSGTRSEFKGASTELMEQGRTIEPGQTLKDLVRIGIEQGNSGVRIIPHNKIPEEILGPQLVQAYKDFLDDKVLACVALKADCQGLVLEREATILKNIANPIKRVMNIEDRFVGEREREKIVIILERGVVIAVHKEPLSREPIEEGETDWLAPFRGISLVGGITIL